MSNKLKDILPEFQHFLLDRKFTSEKYIPFYALKISQFLACVRKEEEKDIEMLMQRFLDLINTKEYLSDRLIRQGGDALAEMKRLMRLKHYSYRTKQTYLDWTKRFFAYVSEIKKTDNPVMTAKI